MRENGYQGCDCYNTRQNLALIIKEASTLKQSLAETQAKLDKAVEFIESGQHTYLGGEYVHCIRLTDKNKQTLKELKGE